MNRPNNVRQIRPRRTALQAVYNWIVGHWRAGWLLVAVLTVGVLWYGQRVHEDTQTMIQACRVLWPK